MKILIVHRYFWPDIPNCGQVLWYIAKHFESEGHSIEILTSLPSRNYNSKKIYAPKFQIIGNIKIIRLNLDVEYKSAFKRILNAIKLGFFTNYFALMNNYDVIVSTSVPPITGGLFSAIAAFIIKARFFYFCMDLHPEIGKISGDFSNTIFYKFLEKIDNWSCSRADSIIVHSLDMKNSLQRRSKSHKFKIDIINNFSVPSEIFGQSMFKKFKKKKKNKLTIIFIGNIGRFQDLENIIRAMGLIKNRKEIELIIVGAGSAKKNLILITKKLNANVIFYDYQSIKVAKKMLEQADIGLVSLRPNIYKYAYPGKIMTYLEQGKPIIAKVELESEIVKKMKIHGYGFYTSNDINQISKLFINIADDNSWRLPMRESALNASIKYFSMEKILKKWSKLVKL